MEVHGLRPIHTLLLDPSPPLSEDLHASAVENPPFPGRPKSSTFRAHTRGCEASVPSMCPPVHRVAVSESFAPGIIGMVVCKNSTMETFCLVGFSVEHFPPVCSCTLCHDHNPLQWGEADWSSCSNVFRCPYPEEWSWLNLLLMVGPDAPSPVRMNFSTQSFSHQG